MVPVEQRVTSYSIPPGYTAGVQINGQLLFHNIELNRLYNPVTGDYYNIKRKGFEKAVPSHFGSSVLDPIDVRPPVDHNGRTWAKNNNSSNTLLKRLAALIGNLANAILASALAVGTAFGCYATYALLVTQGNPVGVVVGFLTLYFAVATYKVSKLAFEQFKN